MIEINNILASRYASASMKHIWSLEGKILFEREFWIAVMKAQKDLGIDISDIVIEDYESVKNQIDLKSIKQREKILRHDVKAKIEEFCALAGHEHIHKGLTSRDLTDNVEQYQILKALYLIKIKSGSALNLLAQKAEEYRSLIIAARTHNVAAQPTTLGKRFAMFGEEILKAFKTIDQLIESYPLRGIKGAVGTLLDIKTLFNNDSQKVEAFQNKIALYLGFNEHLNAVGQVYPRSLDLKVISTLCQVSAGASSLCKTLRIMAGNELLSEGFQKGQVGSSAMPHKMNSRNCERVNGFDVILKGYLMMVGGLSGDQWNEGDVSCSVVRRVALPDAFFAIDGLLETFMTILKEMTIFENMIDQETKRYLPFLISTTLLMEAVKKGVGRERCHEIIKQHSHNVMNDLKKNNISTNDLLKRLGDDHDFPLSNNELIGILDTPELYLGEALKQTDIFCLEIKDLVKKYPEMLQVIPEALI